MLAQIVVGAIAFASTNTDDIVALTLFFAQRGRRVRSILVGQFLGIGALVAVSTVAALAAVAIPPRWLALLGLGPIAVGLKQLRRRQMEGPSTSQAGVWSVAVVTAANGGDNLGVYIPLFAAHAHAIPIYVTVFVLGTALWCATGYAVVNQPRVGTTLERYGHRFVPWVLIGIGIYVLSGWWTG